MNYRRLFQALAAAGFFLFGIAQAEQSPTLPAVAEMQPRTIRLALALNWEGRDLAPYNLEALRAFREQFRDLNILHLVSPNYFAKAQQGTADTDTASRVAQDAIRNVMRPHDQVAVLLSGWKSVASRAGVIFRGGPTFWGQPLSPLECKKDCGLDVPVNIYPEADLDRLIKTSLDSLAANGFGRPKGIAAAGWVASPEVLAAAARAGVRYDFSAVAPELLAKRAGHYPLFGWVKTLWPQVTPHTQPYQISTPGGEVTEFPQATAAIDYLESKDLLALFAEYVDRAERGDHPEELTFPVVFYQETAKWTLPKLTKTLQAMFAYAQSHQVGLKPLVLPGLEIPDRIADQAALSGLPHAVGPDISPKEVPLVH